MIEIRRVNVEAAAELSALCMKSFAEAYRGVHSELAIKAYCDEQYAIDQVRAHLCDPAVTYRVAYREGQAVGFLMTRDEACSVPLPGGSLELKQVYVRASEFGSGLGQRLLADALHQTSTAGKAWLWLSVSDLNDRAKAFYMKHAFQAVGIGPVFRVGEDRLSSTLMARKVVTEKS